MMMFYAQASWLSCLKRNRRRLSLVALTLCGFIISTACSQTPDEERESESPPAAGEPLDADQTSDETEAVRRELLFVKYLGDRAGTSGLDNVRENQPWANFLGYKGNGYRVVKLSSIYRVLEDHTEIPTITAAGEHGTSGFDSSDSWTIDLPTYGTKPMRMFSGMFKISGNDENPIVLHLEMSFVWEDQQWRQLHQSVQEMPTSDAMGTAKSTNQRSQPRQGQ